MVREHAQFFYNFRGLESFKAKLGPQVWQPVYLAYPRGDNAAVALYDALTAFTPQGPTRFALESLALRLGLWAPTAPRSSKL